MRPTRGLGANLGAGFKYPNGGVIGFRIAMFVPPLVVGLTFFTFHHDNIA